MLNKINIFPIFKQHLRSHRNSRTDQILWPEIVGFFLIPLLLASLLAYFFKPSQAFIDGILVWNAIYIPLLTGTLFSVISIGQVDRFSLNGSDDSIDKCKIKDERSLLCQICHNISYLILIGIATCCSLASAQLICEIFNLKFTDCYELTFVRLLFVFVWFLFIQTMLTFLMVIKRLHMLVMISFQK